MRALKSGTNIVDDSNPTDYPDARIKDNTGSGDGTGVNEAVYGDIHQTIAKAMRLYGIIPNGLPENENPSNGFQIIDALRALASKNDFILPITTSSGVLNVPIKLSYMLDNEQVICKSSIVITTETQIKGSDNVTFTITKLGDFKTGEYVRLVKTSSTIILIRLADATSLDLMVGDFSYLKKASQVQEDAGLVETVATTPKSNLTAFVKRVNDAVLSLPYLATTLKNGLYPKEHFDIVANLNNKVKNIGYFEAIDIGSSSGTLVVSGDIVSATAASIANETQVTVVMTNAITGTYYVRSFLQGLSSDLNFDNDISGIIFKPLSTTSFLIRLRELGDVTQSIRVYIEAVQL